MAARGPPAATSPPPATHRLFHTQDIILDVGRSGQAPGLPTTPPPGFISSPGLAPPPRTPPKISIAQKDILRRRPQEHSTQPTPLVRRWCVPATRRVGRLRCAHLLPNRSTPRGVPPPPDILVQGRGGFCVWNPPRKSHARAGAGWPPPPPPTAAARAASAARGHRRGGWRRRPVPPVGRRRGDPPLRTAQTPLSASKDRHARCGTSANIPTRPRHNQPIPPPHPTPRLPAARTRVCVGLRAAASGSGQSTNPPGVSFI